MNILVTGAAGFVASHLCEKLISQGHHVTGIDSFLDYYPRWIKERNLQELKNSKQFRFLEQNLLEADWDNLLKETDILYHLAAQAGVRASWSKNFLIYTKNNIEATQFMLEKARGKKLKKFVYASTSSVYGDTPEIPMKEDSVVRPVSPYGVTKLAAEHLCYLYWKNFGIPCVSLRFFTVYGPRQRPDMGFYKFILAALEKRPILIFEDGNQTRDFTYIDDIVNGTVLAGEKGIDGESYNIGGGTRIALNEALQLLEEIMGTPIERKFAEKQKGDMRHTFASTERIRKDVGYSPQVSLREGLTREYEWLKNLHLNGLTFRVD